ncbi:carboxy terminal-processing peptidase [Halopseudomonas salegens]|uniref:C-terminal processing peptidase-1. Serine peptidase. MEROPS family S41A n=1 Tax=Halopseudomonas salegens TaxID=1434072 RepID=A0A1H2GB59_9GAMM|nr:carboxy terminal-processing peptidase [Halopseudomonas salegens]SDU16739.1 C-terminal processing peptidase-1. Serine peptidase. MEROPS family S41A [Halopseudomonas salegens]
MNALNTLRSAFLISLLACSSLLPAYAEQADSLDLEALQPTREQMVASLNIVELLRRHHYNRIQLNDALSSDIFDLYLEQLDPQRSLFTAQDVSNFEEYRYRMDDLLLDGDLTIGFGMHAQQIQRADQRIEFALQLVDEGLEQLDMNSDEQILVDRENAEWPADEQALEALWRKQITDEVLRLSLAGREMEAISEQLEKRYSNQRNRLYQTRGEDIFQNYINALAQAYDPHTQYMSPENAENFDINMSLSLEGIGAVLQSDNEFTRIVRLVPAGPAQKSQQLEPADRIVGVAQGADEMVDVIGWRLDEVVKLIRGPKGSKVRLDVIPAANAPGDLSSREVSLTREAVKLEDQAARSSILEWQDKEQEYRIGVIEVPGFYLDFKAYRNGDEDYRSTTRDVRRLLSELQEEGVDGVVLDLRNNGGGSLQEATELTGLFIEQGPTVLVRNSQGKVQVLDDSNPGIAYQGPLAVMVNRLSASASEIFAGAMQDYGRALVIGEPTFGKGTVQSIQPLNHGELKLTLAKFYRISGQSTQHRGVVPDIVFPSLLDSREIGESSLPRALPWDTIAPADYNAGLQLAPFIRQLSERHLDRVASDAEFNYTLARVDLNKRMQEREFLPLNKTLRQEQQKGFEAEMLALENRRREARGEEALTEIEEKDPLTESIHALNQEDEDSEDDPFLVETGRILIDMLELNERLAHAG